MIHLTKLNGTDCVLNADLIETLESTPDTTITLVSGHKMNVLEPVDEVVGRVVEFRRRLLHGPQVLQGPWAELEAVDEEPEEAAGVGQGPADAPDAPRGPLRVVGEPDREEP